MAATVDWGTRVITVYQADLTPLGGVSYQLDTEAFKIELRELEASEQGEVHPPILNHATSVTLSGIDYARVIEIINGYTITFEETGSPYKVFLKGSNNNILDVTNLGTVQVAPNNSAGLINITEIQQILFGSAAHIDQVRGYPGLTYPIGAPTKPSDNFTDAVTIANVRGFDELHVIGNGTLTNEDISGFKIYGQSSKLTQLTINTAADVNKCQFYDASIVDSTLDGDNHIERCFIQNLTYVEGILYNCALAGNIQIASATPTYFFDCKSACVGMGASDLPVIDLANGEIHMALRNWAGPVKFINSTNAATTACIDIVSGATITIDSTVTAGTFYIRGTGEVINNSTGTAVVHLNAAVEPEEIRETWRRLGLDRNTPVTNNNDGSYSFAGVDVNATQGAGGEITQQRV